MDVKKFNEKFNKLGGNIYVVEEEVTLTNGVYEAELEHDNVNLKTINIYTGSKLTGDKINAYTTSTPSLAPWKTVIKIFSTISPLYISYETTGDTVEADDINNVQDAIVDTQNALNAEINRASGSESTIAGNLNAEIIRAKGSENTITNTINSNKPNWDDKYTKNEVDNKFNVLTTNIDWKESVPTFNDIATTYSTPQDGWTVNVKDTDVTYRYSGTAWIPISANSIPLATSTVDGKMSKQDKVDHDDMVSKKHTHDNKGILDVITQALIDTWNNSYTHISDVVRHITSTERTSWNNAFSHISDAIRHITADERTNWNNAKSSIDSLQIGGRNILRNTSKFSSCSYWNGNITIDSTVLYEGYPTFLSTGGEQLYSDPIRLRPNTHYVWSFMVRVTIANSSGEEPSPVHIQCWTDENTNNVHQETNTNDYDSVFVKDTWKRCYRHFITPNSNTPVYMRAYIYNFGTNPTNFTNFKVEEGTKPTDWTPSPEDKADAIHTHDDRYYTETEADNKFATKGEISASGQGDMLKSVYDTNGDGIVNNADMLDGKHASDFALLSDTVKKTTSDITYYVSDTGSDSNSGLTTALPFKTIQYAIDSLPYIINHNVYINLNGELGAFTLENHVGKGNMYLRSMEYVSTGSTHVDSCYIQNALISRNICSVTLIGICAHTITSQSQQSPYDYGFYIKENSGKVEINKCKTSIVVTGIEVDYSQNVYIHDSDISCYGIGITSRCNSIVISENNTSSSSPACGLSVNNGVIMKTGTQPSGNQVSSSTSNGGVIR